jgi:hypothetical protein
MDASLIDRAMAIIDALKEKGVILNGDGIFDKRAVAKWIEWAPTVGVAATAPVPFTREEVAGSDCIVKAMKLIPFLVLKTTRKGMVGSYGLKHRIEKLITTETRGSYMENGQAILAMLLLRYTIIYSKDGSWNCTFHCKYALNDHYQERGGLWLETWQKL